LSGMKLYSAFSGGKQSYGLGSWRQVDLNVATMM